ncbi:histidine phosphatase family protein [bacterium]|nr:histidine phosphatase family protein [bacterium]
MHKRRFISFRQIFALTGTVFFCIAAHGSGQADKAEQVFVTARTKIYLVRHAERDPGPDPPLNEKGRARAQSLKELLADSGITAIICPDWERNKQTAGPLADHLDLTIQVLPQDLRDDSSLLAEYFIEKILPAHMGENILFIGNMSTSRRGEEGNLYTLYRIFNKDSSPLARYNDFHIIVLEPNRDPVFFHAIYGAADD